MIFSFIVSEKDPPAHRTASSAETRGAQTETRFGVVGTSYRKKSEIVKKKKYCGDDENHIRDEPRVQTSLSRM